MFNLVVDGVDVIVLRRVLLNYAKDLETAQAKCDAEGQAAPVMDERAYRFIQYAQQLGAHATGKLTHMDTHWNQGYLAHDAKAPRTANESILDADVRRQWLAGWDTARERDMEPDTGAA